MTAPVHYIVLALMFMSATISLAFILAWSAFGRKPCAISWSGAFLAATCQWAVILMSSWFPSVALNWIAACAFGLAFVTLGLRGHCQRTHCKYLPRNLWPFAIVAYFGILWSTVLQPHVGISSAILPGVFAISLLMSARMIVVHRTRSRPAEIAAAVTMVVFGLAQLSAATVAFMQGPTGAIAMRDLYTMINFISLPAGYAGLAILLLLMLASDLSEDLKELAIRDQLTGALNRRGFGEHAARAYATARRTSQPVSVIMADIDHFKTINDNHGHHIGDLALCRFTDLLRAGRRNDDITARMGGEEFALVLPGTGMEEAMRIADELCDRIESTPIEIDGDLVPMTASFGVATIAARDDCLTDVIIRADRALYRSKKEGRNRVDLESSQIVLALDGTLKSASS